MLNLEWLSIKLVLIDFGLSLFILVLWVTTNLSIQFQSSNIQFYQKSIWGQCKNLDVTFYIGLQVLYDSFRFYNALIASF